MKILVTEDDPEKLREIIAFVRSIGFSNDDILTAASMAEFGQKLDPSVAICVIDLRIPAFAGGAVEQNGRGVLEIVRGTGRENLKLLAISSFPEEFEGVRGSFEKNGCMIVSFHEKEIWQNALKLLSVQCRSVERMDFLIFCALRSERAPYTGMPELQGQPKFVDNLTRYDIAVGDKRGTIIELPRMGLVDAASIMAMCIERFSPDLVGMSGICAGFLSRASLGQLLVSELAFEYQSGKWTPSGFSQEPYQVPASEVIRSVARELLEDEEVLQRVESGCRSKRPVSLVAPKLAAFTSGSAVIDSSVAMEQIGALHRRVCGLDMEVYALHRAAHLAKCVPDVLCVKAVVDLAGGEKDDDLQPYGAFISAKFMIEAIGLYFLRKKTGSGSLTTV